MNNEQQNRHSAYNSLISATMLGWLLDQGCELSEETLSVLPKLQSADPRWQPSLDKNANELFGESTGGFVDVVTEPAILLSVPLSEVIDLAETNPTYSKDFSIEYKPFDGLVRQYPRRAVAALTLATKRGQYPEKFWKSLLREWPDTTSPRLTFLLSERLKQLPANVVMLLRFDVFSWLTKNAPKLNSTGQAHALGVLDTLLDILLTTGPDATNSTILNERVARDDQGWSRRTMMHAMNGPVGNAVQFLLTLLKSQDLAQGSGIPQEIKSRLERLTTASGEGSDHAVCLLCRNVEWLYFLDPDWTSSTVVPWFDPNHPNAEPAWNGFCFSNRMPEPEPFSLLKPHFLNVFRFTSAWKWRDQEFRVLHNRLVIGCLWREHHKAYLSVNETRTALQMTNHVGRSHCIYYLTDLIENDKVKWDQFGKTFLNQAWPKENQFQSKTTTLSLVHLASVTGDNFPDVVHTIIPRLVHVNRSNWLACRVLSENNSTNIDLVARYPSETLALINKITPNNLPEIPFDLNTTLEKIALSEPNLRQDPKWQRLRKIARNE